MEEELAAASEQIKTQKEEEISAITKSARLVALASVSIIYFFVDSKQTIFIPGRKDPGTPRHTPKRMGL